MTHCDRLLAVLSDGCEHDHHELYALGMIVHSRVAELRKRGHAIEQWRDGDRYVYRLATGDPGVEDGALASPDSAAVSDAASPVAPLSAGLVLSPDAPASPGAGPAEQLTLEAAA